MHELCLRLQNQLQNEILKKSSNFHFSINFRRADIAYHTILLKRDFKGMIITDQQKAVANEDC